MRQDHEFEFLNGCATRRYLSHGPISEKDVVNPQNVQENRIGGVIELRDTRVQQVYGVTNILSDLRLDGISDNVNYCSYTTLYLWMKSVMEDLYYPKRK